MTIGNPKNPGPAPHMTIGIEHQAYGSVAARAINKGTMTLEKTSAKTGGLASNIGCVLKLKIGNIFNN